MNKLVDGTASFFSLLGSLAVAFVAIATTVNVLLRAAGPSSISGMVDLSVILLVIIVFTGIAQAERTDTHVRMQLITDRLPPHVAASVRGVSQAASAVIVSGFIYATADRALQSFRVGERQVSALGWPVWPARMLITVGLSLLLLVSLRKAWFFFTAEGIDHQGGPADSSSGPPV